MAHGNFCHKACHLATVTLSTGCFIRIVGVQSSIDSYNPAHNRLIAGAPQTVSCPVTGTRDTS